jgi:toxin YoeB
MEIVWAPQASEDYDYWLTSAATNERAAKALERIKELIADIQEHPFTGLGKPEPLKHNWSGFWSRHITGEHRFVYRVTGRRPRQVLAIAQCRLHY